jgi:NAD(P)-dependent dehydrogenase (short-subunit alcohol dehydrogenase family)
MSLRIVNDLKAFDGRTVVITGGGSGIGLATARVVVDRGGSVILMGRSLDRLKAAQAQLGTAASVAELDVSDEDAVRRVFTDIERVDHLVTAAAGTLCGRLIDVDTLRARELFGTKFWGQYHCVKYAASRMPTGGSVALFSGWISRKPVVEMSTLAAVDGAIEARTLALELAPVRVNAITPGHIDTPLWRSRLSDAEARAHFDRVAHALPVGRVGTAEDVDGGWR